MQSKQLQYFITAYATKNIQRAAEKLFGSLYNEIAHLKN